ncbi:MAG TPA: ArsR family transcriptional regulator [Candidatus Nanopelagicaceae bacterium]
METSPLADRSRKPHFGPAASAPLKGQVRNLSKARAKILEFLSEGPCTVSSLAVRTGQHENTIREHLDALVDDELAIKYQDSEHVRGRPAWLYRIPDTGEIREYAGLASALAGAIARTSSHPIHSAVEAGIAWAPELIRSSHANADRSLPSRRRMSATAMRRNVIDLLRNLNFAPKANADLTRIKLTQCPLLDAARQHPEIICSVHLGIIRGALKEFGAETTSINEIDLQPFAEKGSCILRM